ncbi:hypothetical protein [Pseudobdellovibrio exovorus]|uniref:hypothetical protein n=1 Tax=Pseudobdellovibrio exovorus TaxID=453816 RepID=UPI0011D2219B|nr:hypothetical protein [Pseudobdellovibrio exovorus]
MKILILSLLSVFSMSVAARGNSGGSGATTVGDGGHVVVCYDNSQSKKEVQLLDLFEMEALGYPTTFALGNAQVPLANKVWMGMTRLQSHLGLSNAEVDEMVYAADRFMRFPYDPWETGMRSFFGYFLQAKPVEVRRSVFDEMERRGCRLEVAVIRPDLDAERASTENYKSICSRSFAGFHYCFLMNTDLIRKMDKDQKACLIIHEVLRFLPKEKKIQSERALRRHTYYACTGQLAV